MNACPKPEKRMSRQEALALADRNFSLLMRAYHSVDGIVTCVTCGVEMPWSGTGVAHWGHWKDRQYIWVRWDPCNGGVQCEGCNSYQGGRQDEMRAYLVQAHGKAEVERIEREFRDMACFSVEDILELNASFEAKLNEIVNEKRLSL